MLRFTVLTLALAALAACETTKSRTKKSDLVATASAAGDFETLTAALEAADLVGTLQGKGPFTVFAPTDAAFAALPKGTVERLLKPENKAQLVKVLTYHVVAGAVPAAEASQLTSAKTVQGQSLRIRTRGDSLLVNDATVVNADVFASNGVIHAIDRVLLPE